LTSATRRGPQIFTDTFEDADDEDTHSAENLPDINLHTQAEIPQSLTAEQLLALVRQRDNEITSLKKALWMEGKVGRTKKSRSKCKRKLRELAKQSSLHVSPNTMLTIRNHEKRSQATETLSDDDLVYAFVFAMPADTFAADEANENDVRVSHECWMLVETIMSCELSFRAVLPVDRKVIVIAVGAAYDILVDEAHHTRIFMRLQETKGSMEFHEDLIRYYASNHGGLNEYQNGQWIKRDSSLVEQHWKPWKELASEDQENQHKRNRRIFTSSLKQQLVLSRLQRRAGYDPEHAMNLSASHSAAARAIKFIDRRRNAKNSIGAAALHDALICVGGYRPKNNRIFKEHGDSSNVVSELARMVQMNWGVVQNYALVPQLLVRDECGKSSIPSSSLASTLTHERCAEFVCVLESWTKGPGREECWTGTMKNNFPLHCAGELKFLKEKWGSPRLLCATRIYGFAPEYAPKVLDPGDDSRGPKHEMNTFGSSGNTIKEHTLPASLVYQPIEEIRDYFGDQVGLYFSWLGTYTKALFMMSVLGNVVMVCQPIFGGINNNPLTLAYSVYTGIWSIAFIETWVRRETEHQFLWGTEHLEDIEKPRAHFVGRLLINSETGTSRKVHKSNAVYYLKQFVGVVIVMLFIVCTILCALAAQMVRYLEVENLEDASALEANKFKLMSSALNLVIIAVFGQTFLVISQALTRWENHRTQSEFDNAIVGKNSHGW
jgi:hypothetical protein